MRLERDGLVQLEGKTDTELARALAAPRQEAVVESAAAPEAMARPVKSEPRDEHQLREFSQLEISLVPERGRNEGDPFSGPERRGLGGRDLGFAGERRKEEETFGRFPPGMRDQPGADDFRGAGPLRRGQLLQGGAHPEAQRLLFLDRVHRLETRCFTGPSLYRSPTVPIPFSKKRKIVRQNPGKDGAEKGGTRVGLRPGQDWHKRNFLTKVLIPSLFTKREGERKPVQPPQFPEVQPGQVCVTWIGHASFLLQTSELNILVDPNWSRWLKVIKRLKQPGFEIHHLPEIDYVLVTHAHFDHLDRRTLRKVAADQPIIVPTGVGNLVHDLGFNIVHELDHWQQVELEGLRVSLTPCHHWGARFLADRHRGFGGFVIETAGRSIFHCGDSAYFDGFGEIGQRYNVELALLPIGAYDPPSGREVHMNPEEAILAFKELRASKLVPMHYGSFRLGYEPMDEPLTRLRASAQTHAIEDKLVIMTEGMPVVL